MNLLKINYVCCVPSDLILQPVVYKYRVANELFYKSLLSNEIWLAKPNSFNDPFEPQRIFSGTPFSQALKRSVREAGVLCLCKSSSNLPMWSYYGDGLRGVALGYDLAVLLATLEPVEPSKNEVGVPRWKYVFDMVYDNDGLCEIDEKALRLNDSLTDAEWQKMFATKSLAFSHEEECRIAVQPSPDSDTDFSWYGYGLYQHAPNALSEIIFGELIPDQDRLAIMKILAGREITYWNAERDQNSFKINIVPVTPTSLPLNVASSVNGEIA